METKKLKQTVNLIVKEKLNTIPILDNVFVDSGDVVMTSLDVTLRIKHFFDQKFSTLVNAKKFVSFLELAKDPVNFIEGESNAFTDLYGKVSLGKADKIEEFPLAPIPKDVFTKAQIRSEDIQKYLVALKFVADDELRPVMNCVLHEDHIVASNAHIMYFSPAYKAIADPLLIPDKVVRLLGIYPDKYFVTADDKHVFLFGKDVDIIYRKVDGLYPAWKAVVPQKFDFEIHTCLKKFVKAIDYVRPYMNKVSELIKINVSANELRISSQDLDFGISAEIKIRSTMKILSEVEKPSQFQIGFKYSFMKKICAILEDDELLIQVINPDKATMFGGLLLMPMMINA
jgi:DNA polymerase-3 subunit beta